MDILRPLLPDTKQGKILKKWDLKYNPESRGAYLFENFYKELYLEVFGKNGFGTKALRYLEEETSIFIDFYYNFDRVLLAPKSRWFGNNTREEIFKRVAEKALKVEPKKWKEVQKFIMKHLLFGDKLPNFLGFNRGPIVGLGGRSTIHQGQIYRSEDRDTTFMPSIRTVTDLSDKKYFSVLSGGPSDRRFSKWYFSDMDNWLKGKYKNINFKPDQKKYPF